MHLSRESACLTPIYVPPAVVSVYVENDFAGLSEFIRTLALGHQTEAKVESQ